MGNQVDRADNVRLTWCLLSVAGGQLTTAQVTGFTLG